MECFGSHYRDAQGKCLPLPEGCEAATPNGVCTRCYEGYLKDPARPGCLSCPDGCEACRLPVGREKGLQCTKCYRQEMPAAPALLLVPELSRSILACQG